MREQGDSALTFPITQPGLCRGFAPISTALISPTTLSHCTQQAGVAPPLPPPKLRLPNGSHFQRESPGSSSGCGLTHLICEKTTCSGEPSQPTQSLQGPHFAIFSKQGAEQLPGKRG